MKCKIEINTKKNKQMCLNKDTKVMCYEYKRINAVNFPFYIKIQLSFKSSHCKLIKERKKNRKSM